MFCGIARPEGPAAMLEAEGCRTVGAMTYRDHHVYAEQDVTELVGAGAGEWGGWICDDEKDAVKLSAAGGKGSG